MNQFEKFSNLKALEWGLKPAVADAKAEVEKARRDLRIRGVQDTDWGTISSTPHPPKIRYFEDQLLEHAKEEYPHEVVPEHTETIVVPEAVRPTLLKTLEARHVIVDGEVIDTQTGAVVEFAYIEPGEPDTITFRPNAEQKERAAVLVADRLEVLAAAVTREVSS